MLIFHTVVMYKTLQYIVPVHEGMLLNFQLRVVDLDILKS